MKRDLICIICPKGCSIQAEIDGENVKVLGNTCPKGEQYAKDECIHPTRTVTTFVRVSNREDTMVSVKTKDPIPKENIFDLMNDIRKINVDAPIEIGDIICDNVFGTCVIATKDIK